MILRGRRMLEKRCAHSPPLRAPRPCRKRPQRAWPICCYCAHGVAPKRRRPGAPQHGLRTWRFSTPPTVQTDRGRNLRLCLTRIKGGADDDNVMASCCYPRSSKKNASLAHGFWQTFARSTNLGQITRSLFFQITLLLVLFALVTRTTTGTRSNHVVARLSARSRWSALACRQTAALPATLCWSSKPLWRSC